MYTCCRDEVEESSSARKETQTNWKKFFDEGDYRPGDQRRTTDFIGGEFTVLCYQPGSGGQSASHWCE